MQEVCKTFDLLEVQILELILAHILEVLEDQLVYDKNKQAVLLY